MAQKAGAAVDESLFPKNIPDRALLVSPAVTERNMKIHSQRRGQLKGAEALQSFEKVVDESAIGDYTVE